MPEPSSKSWPEVIAATVGARVAHYRKGRFTAAQLSKELSQQLRVDMKRTVIGGLESGVRKTVSLSEILALAYVLGVPPLLLMTPLGAQQEFDVLPGTAADTWEAARWITGEGPPPSGIDPTTQRGDRETLWITHVDLLQLYRRHTAAVAEWRSRTNAASIGDSREEADRMFERALARRREIEDGLRLIRRAIRARGEIPPPLPAELARLDEEGGPDGSAENPADPGR